MPQTLIFQVVRFSGIVEFDFGRCRLCRSQRADPEGRVGEVRADGRAAPCGAPASPRLSTVAFGGLLLAICGRGMALHAASAPASDSRVVPQSTSCQRVRPSTSATARRRPQRLDHSRVIVIATVAERLPDRLMPGCFGQIEVVDQPRRG